MRLPSIVWVQFYLWGSASASPPFGSAQALSLPKRHRTRLARRFKRSCGVRTRLRYHNKKILPRTFNYTPIVLLVLSLVATGCVSNKTDSEFVGTITFSSLDTFSYKDTIVTGLDFREFEERQLQDLSGQIVPEAFSAKDFERVESGGDFFVVTKWEKAVSNYPDPFDHVDGATEFFERADRPSHRFGSRIHLTVEVYESSSGKLFWRKHLPNIFDSVQFTEERVVAALQRAAKNFPVRVPKDPNLPNIE